MSQYAVATSTKLTDAGVGGTRRGMLDLRANHDGLILFFAPVVRKFNG